MPRPTSKTDLLETMTVEYQKLQALLQPLNESRMTQAGVCGDWSIKDMLGHLTEWQRMVLSWYQDGAAGKDVKTPAPDLKWSEIPILNQRIYEQYRDVPLADMRQQLEASHAATRQVLEGIPDEALVTPRFYRWTNTSTLLSYFVSCTSSHYHWACTEIRKWLRAQATG